MASEDKHLTRAFMPTCSISTSDWTSFTPSCQLPISPPQTLPVLCPAPTESVQQSIPPFPQQQHARQRSHPSRRRPRRRRQLRTRPLPNRLLHKSSTHSSANSSPHGSIHSLVHSLVYSSVHSSSTSLTTFLVSPACSSRAAHIFCNSPFLSRLFPLAFFSSSVVLLSSTFLEL